MPLLATGSYITRSQIPTSQVAASLHFAMHNPILPLHPEPPMRPLLLLTFVFIFLPAMATQAAAQQPDTTQSDASRAHHALKTAGRNTKAEAKSVGSSIHHSLRTAGNNTKAALKRVTRDTGTKTNHKPGGLNKVARSVSGDFKTAGRKTKSAVKNASGQTHHALKTTGNDVKSRLKKQPHDTTAHP